MVEWDPFKEMKRVQDRINKKVNSLMGGYKKPYSNITQNPKNVVINVELPGIKKKNIFLDVNDEKLVVKADENSRKIKEKEDIYSEIDKSLGYYRSIVLPKGLAVDKTEAKLSGKVLKIRIPKRKTSKKVSIK
ncbi:Hsp20/alpha crystallin family protein [Candidatus Woesearchaeota archaeon]|nr:Hsp20/alpha crystallin family protein [Candidatus Woesearchaeota archaeon]